MAGAVETDLTLARVAKRLGRAEHTVRRWVGDGVLPRELRPRRVGGRRVIVWSEDQIEGLRAFAAERKARRGWPSR